MAICYITQCSNEANSDRPNITRRIDFHHTKKFRCDKNDAMYYFRHQAFP